MTHHARVQEAVDALWDEEVGFLQRLVRYPSTLGNEAEAQECLYQEFTSMGLTVDRFDVDVSEIESLPGYSPALIPYEGRPNVVGVRRGAGGGGRSVILQGHIDVVPAEPFEHWTHSPWDPVIREGRMYGRGAGDMKSGIAAMVYALKAVEHAGLTLKGDVILQSVIEEECTGNGALAACARGYRADACLIPEATAGTVFSAQLGVIWMRVSVRGQGAHVERADRAVNAIEKCLPLIAALKELEREVNEAPRPPEYELHPHPINYNIGVFEGGKWPSSVPEVATFDVRIGLFPGQALEGVRERAKARVLEAAARDPWLRDHPPEITFRGLQAEGLAIPQDQPLVKAIRAAHETVTGDAPGTWAATATTDVRFYALYYGIPATCYGQLSGNGHAPDEWVDLQSLRLTTKSLAVFLIDWCGVG